MVVPAATAATETPDKLSGWTAAATAAASATAVAPPEQKAQAWQDGLAYVKENGVAQDPRDAVALQQHDGQPGYAGKPVPCVVGEKLDTFNRAAAQIEAGATAAAAPAPANDCAGAFKDGLAAIKSTGLSAEQAEQIRAAAAEKRAAEAAARAEAAAARAAAEAAAREAAKPKLPATMFEGAAMKTNPKYMLFNSKWFWRWYKADGQSNKLRYFKCDEAGGGTPAAVDAASWEKFYVLAGARVQAEGPAAFRFFEGPGGRDCECECTLESAGRRDEFVSAIEAAIEYANFFYGDGGGGGGF